LRRYGCHCLQGGFGFQWVALNWLVASVERAGPWAPGLFVALFLGASILMIWRLEAMTRSGVEGTVLGTLVMPYCSGMGNLVFAFVVGGRHGPGSEVITNALVNNVTNLTLLIGLPAAIWGLSLLPAGKVRKKQKKGAGAGQEHQIHRLSLLLTLTAGLFFTGAAWALARDGKLDFGDGLVLVGLFLFWQCFHVFEVLKTNVRQNQSFKPRLFLDLGILAAGAFCVYVSTDWLVAWVTKIQTGFVSVKHLGWLSGWLMVLPNATLSFYYAWRGNPEVVYTSQVGDGHICIPLSIGICALYAPMGIPEAFWDGIPVLVAAGLFHFTLVALFGRLPRAGGWILTLAYGVFLYRGLPR
jgi:cation:H+ antiporter